MSIIQLSQLGTIGIVKSATKSRRTMVSYFRGYPCENFIIWMPFYVLIIYSWKLSKYIHHKLTIKNIDVFKQLRMILLKLFFVLLQFFVHVFSTDQVLS